MTDRWVIASLALALVAGTGASDSLRAASAPDDPAAIARTIRADVASLIAGLNAHDVSKMTAFDAPGIVSMECGRPSSSTLEDERAGLSAAFKANPAWRARLIDDTVDVAKAGDIAVYRGTYYQDSVHDGQPVTQRVNFIAEFAHRTSGSWQVVWSMVAPMEASHPK